MAGGLRSGAVGASQDTPEALSLGLQHVLDELAGVSRETRRVLLLLGSNADAQAQLQRASARLASDFPLLAQSACFHSPAERSDSAPAYLNQALLIATDLLPTELKARLRAIEADLGRQRPAPDPSLCPIDIDQLLALEHGCWQILDQRGVSAVYAQAPLLDLLAGIGPAVD